MEFVRDPRQGTFEVTLRCNLRCKMCLFRRSDAENAQLARRELSPDAWEKLAREAAEAGTLELLITGGEPMVRGDFCELYERVYSHGFLLELYTNGTLVTPEIMDTLRRCPPHRLGLTIYGASAETYERVCGNGAAFDRAMRGFEALSQLPSEKSFRTTIIRDNIKDLRAMEELVRDRFSGGQLTHTTEVRAAVRGGASRVGACRLSPQENVRFLMERYENALRDYVRQKGWPEDTVRLTGYEPPRREEDGGAGCGDCTLLGCRAGMDSYTITFDGRMLCCQLLGNFSTDPAADGLMNAWNRLPFAVRLPERNPACASCALNEYCTSCPAVNFAETGSLNGCPQYIKEELETLLTYYKGGKDNG